jgi:hypothetical protein
MPDDDTPASPTNLRMRDPGSVTVPVTVTLPFAGQVTLADVENELLNLQLGAKPDARVTFGTTVSRLQANSTITLLDLTISSQSQLVADVILKGTEGWLDDAGRKLNPDIATHLHLLNFKDLQLTLYGEAKLDVDPQGPKVKAEFVGGGLQIQWGGTLPAGTAKRPRH